MSYFIAVKSVHVTSVVGSLILFALRGIWRLQYNDIVNRRWVKIVPHAVDSILLISGILLTIEINQFPFVHTWLTAKVIAVLFYILFGLIAFRFAKSKVTLSIFWLFALTTFGYIIKVALTHDPVPV